MGKSALVLVALVLVAAIGLFIWRDPGQPICSDEVRSMSERMDVALKSTAASLANVSIEGDQEIDDKLADLTSATYGQLSAMRQECNLLARCLQWKFAASAAESCPIDYGNYRSRVDQVLDDLILLSMIQSQAVDLTKLSQDRREAEVALEELQQNNLTPNPTAVVRLTQLDLLLARDQESKRERLVEGISQISANWGEQ
jgi:hypothetical protein